MARGGRRQGTPGKRYTNRTDLQSQPRTQPVQAPTGQPYGQAGAQQAAQRAIPLPELGPFDRPTERPAEPLTSGLPVGPGPGPEAINMLPPPGGLAAPQQSDPVVDVLTALYQEYPDEDLRRLLEATQRYRG